MGRSWTGLEKGAGGGGGCSVHWSGQDVVAIACMNCVVGGGGWGVGGSYQGFISVILEKVFRF